MRQIFLIALLALAWSCTGALAQSCTKPDGAISPIVATHTLPPYPAMSQSMAESGTTLLEVVIGTDGAASTTKVIASSGSLRLDDVAADYVKQNWKWTPATRNCLPIAAMTRVSIAWSLRYPPSVPTYPILHMGLNAYPPAMLAEKEQGNCILAVSISATGAILDLRILQSSGFADMDQASLQAARQRKYQPLSIDGVSAMSAVVLGVQWNFPPPVTIQSAPAPSPTPP